MSIFLLKDPNCVLIHIPKTGGTSVRKGVWKKNYEGPAHGRVPAAWQTFFKFAFVRHPLDRFISAYKMFSEGAVGDDDWRMPSDARPISIAEFSEIVLDDAIIFDERRSSFEEKIRHHTIPQTHPFNALAEAEFVGRYEKLAEDFQTVCNVLGIDRALPKMHSTNHRHWSSYIDEPLLSRLVEFYEEDFRTLGYEIPAT